MILLRSILSLLAVASAVDGLASSAAKNAPSSASTGASSAAIYKGLASTPLVRASDNAPVVLTELWRANTPFGIADEFAVCAFLRHYG